MKKPQKPRETASKKNLKDSGPETPPESKVISGLTPAEPPESKSQEPTETDASIRAAADEDLKPWIEVLFPPEGYDIPGAGEFGIVVGHVRVERAAPDIQLGNVTFSVDGVQGVYHGIPDSANTWEVTEALKIPYNAGEGSHELRFWVSNRFGPGQRNRFRNVFYRDTTSPEIEIVSPKDGATVPLGLPLDVYGWAEDRQSGVAAIECSRDGVSIPPAEMVTDPQNRHRVNWRFVITNLDPGVRTITMRFRDKKGHEKRRDITITATGAYKPEGDLASLRAYLEDLLKYAEDHVKVGNAKLTKADLTNLFYQPFEQLIDIRNSSGVPLGSQPVNQLRAAIEVLRKYLVAAPNERPSSTRQLTALRKFSEDRGDKPTDATPIGPNLSPALTLSSPSAVTEAEYRLAAYQALLSRIGTSDEEIRLVRGADDGTRKALASRLGITLDPELDQLEKLYLSAVTITEANLENLFGLADTTRDPLTNLPEPLLLRWRRNHLEELWRKPDEPADSQSEAPLPIIDPDLIGKDDIRPTDKGNAALDIWQARTKWLADTFAALKQTSEGWRDALKGFDTIASETLGKPVDDLLKLDGQQRAGTDIEPELKKLHLTRQAFTRLLRVRKMAENQTVSDAEWNEVFHILVQAKKQQGYDAWRTEEQQKQIALTPSLFQISETVPELTPWRATWRSRLNWLDTLQARMDQRQTTEDALRVAVSAAEEQTLPVLRDALLMGLANRWGLSAAEIAEWLTRRLLVDLKTNASQRTTRLIQAIETVQGVLFALRAGQLATSHPAAEWKLAVDEGHFDEEWQWMGNYSTWRAAMFVFYFPETVLLPSLREPYDASKPFAPHHQTEQFAALLKVLRKRPRLTPDQARIEAGTYLNALLNDDRLKDTSPNAMPKKLRDAINATRPSPEQAPAFLTDQHTDETLGKLRQLCSDLMAPSGNQLGPNYLQEIFYCVPMQLSWQLQKSGVYLAALDWLQTVYAYNLPASKQKIYYGLERETNVAPILSQPDHWLTSMFNLLNPHAIADSRTGSNPHTRYTLMSLARCITEFADSEFTRDTAESLARARALYLTAERVLFSSDLDTPSEIPPDATVLPNPLLELLRLRVEIQLTKMRQGRNIAGMKRQVELPVSLPPGPNDLPTIGAGGQLVIPGARPALRPTPYYFRVLLERSKQLVNIAQQIEAAYLAALEKLDAENYNLLRANNDLQLAFEGVELQNRRVQEAQAGVGVARAQLQRAQVMSERYNMMSSLGLNLYEQQMISSYQEAIGFIRQAGGASATAAIFGGTASYLSSLAAAAQALTPVPGILPSPPNPVVAGLHMASGAAAMAGAAMQAKAAIYSANIQAAQTNASIAGVWASHESRRLDYETQAAIAEQEIAIGEAQIGAAQAHVGVADQERRIAQTQITQAQAVADFLARKFTNAELYEWMSGVLGEVYSYFLQQATALAQLAENQLAFERQDTPPKFIQVDYWDVPSEAGSLTTDQKAPDRKGLTGSARLLRDLYQLDQYAFETNKRKLNLSQTFSLARMAPFDFEQFRQTGVLTFATPMSLFDHDFPGHYLRLIQRVRTSVIALIPPHHGIRASLIASGISRVVTGGDVFQQIVVRRDPELVALTSPINATGVFEMDVQSEMHLPFESMGVDTFWEFQMPRAANPFDFRTVADVLVTIEYTALNSFDYRQQVIKMLDAKLSGERSFSFRNQFPDAWYDLHNPEQRATPITVKFKTWREDFPPNLDDLKIEHVLLFFSRVVDESAGDQPFEMEVSNFLFTPKSTKDAVGSGASTIDGVISTRRWNGAGWNGMIGKTPAGEWELTLPNTEEITKRFKNEKIDDMLLVITYGGRTPAWPA
ncbi:MAG: Ig-like domain-containing protein [bacterium]